MRSYALRLPFSLISNYRLHLLSRVVRRQDCFGRNIDHVVAGSKYITAYRSEDRNFLAHITNQIVDRSVQMLDGAVKYQLRAECILEGILIEDRSLLSAIYSAPHQSKARSARVFVIEARSSRTINSSAAWAPPPRTPKWIAGAWKSR